MKLLKNIFWYWKRFWGRKEYIEFTDKLKFDEILHWGHKIYLSEEVKDIIDILRERINKE